MELASAPVATEPFFPTLCSAPFNSDLDQSDTFLRTVSSDVSRHTCTHKSRAGLTDVSRTKTPVFVLFLPIFQRFRWDSTCVTIVIAFRVQTASNRTASAISGTMHNKRLMLLFPSGTLLRWQISLSLIAYQHRCFCCGRYIRQITRKTVYFYNGNKCQRI